jgi:hypothetical protein
MKPAITILDAVADAKLFASWFRDRDTWAAWLAFLAALFALPMTPEQVAIYRRCTGRVEPPKVTALEAWLVCGRRAGKSFVLALIAVFIGCFHDFRPRLAPGERGTILIVAVDRRQARVILRYVRALLTGVPMLARLVERETAEAFDLSNAVTIEVATASFRTVRGYTIIAALLDELAFFRTDDAAEPDYEILDAIRPGMATIPGAMLLCASSPYARRGALWTAHRKHFAQENDPVLVWQAPTREMNPTVPQRVVDEATERDPASAAAEYLAHFRTDVETFVSREAVEACVDPGVFERAPLASVRYSAFVDPSGGSSDSMTLAIAHRDGGDAVLDAVRERRPPFSPEAVVADFAVLLKSYRVSKVTGDRYAGEWPRERFREHSIRYEASTRPKSDLYRDMLPILNSGKLSLLDHPRFLAQMVSLERRSARGGRDSIDHPPSGHDDLSNSVAGVVAALASGRRYTLDGVCSPEDRLRGWTIGERLVMSTGRRF